MRQSRASLGLSFNLTDLNGRECRRERRECICGCTIIIISVVVDWRIHVVIVSIIRMIHNVVDILVEISSDR